MWAIPAFIARAQASTSGTKMKFSRNLMPTMRHAGDQPVVHDLERRASLVERLPRVSSSTVSSSPVDQRRGDEPAVGRRAARTADQPLALVGPLDELVDLLAEEVVGDVAELRHLAALAAAVPLACHSRRPRGSRGGSRSGSAGGSRTRGRPSGRRPRGSSRTSCAHLGGALRVERLGVVDVADEADAPVDDRHRLLRARSSSRSGRPPCRSRRCTPSGRPCGRRCAG